MKLDNLYKKMKEVFHGNNHQLYTHHITQITINPVLLVLLVRMNMLYTTGSDETDFPQELWKRFTSGVRKNVTSLGRTVTKRKTIKKRLVLL